MEFFKEISTTFNYWIYIIIMMTGLYAMIAKNNLVKKLIGMSIFQTAIILFYVSIGYKEGATIPILFHDQVHPPHHADVSHDTDTDGHHEVERAAGAEAAKEVHAEADSHHEPGTDVSHDDHASLEINPDEFENPLPHVLMLTAIVVGVATLGVGLAITQKVYREYGSIEESEILELIKSGND